MVEVRGPKFLTPVRAGSIIACLALLALLVASLALTLGSEHIAPRGIGSGFWAWLTSSPSPLSAEQQVILFGLRLPRIALALGVGASLAISGAAFQALLRNPLAVSVHPWCLERRRTWNNARNRRGQVRFRWPGRSAALRERQSQHCSSIGLAEGRTSRRICCLRV